MYRIQESLPLHTFASGQCHTEVPLTPSVFPQLHFQFLQKMALKKVENAALVIQSLQNAHQTAEVNRTTNLYSFKHSASTFPKDFRVEK